jgi:hypothetical protein
MVKFLGFKGQTEIKGWALYEPLIFNFSKVFAA